MVSRRRELIAPPFALGAGCRLEKYKLVIIQKRVPDLTELALTRFVARARSAAGLKGGVDVLITSNAEMKSLNRRFRGKDKPTDVLSFPAAPESIPTKLAGEIAISGEIAAQNARALGHPTALEVKVLVLHGILHLRGYDHEQDNGEMARRERQLRFRLRLPEGLIERTNSGKAAAKKALGEGVIARKRRNPVR
jgi:probable rRNA maturation factor